MVGDGQVPRMVPILERILKSMSQEVPRDFGKGGAGGNVAAVQACTQCFVGYCLWLDQQSGGDPVQQLAEALQSSSLDGHSSVSSERLLKKYVLPILSAALTSTEALLQDVAGTCCLILQKQALKHIQVGGLFLFISESKR